jgi:hypothetical protein
MARHDHVGRRIRPGTAGLPLAITIGGKLAQPYGVLCSVLGRQSASDPWSHDLCHTLKVSQAEDERRAIISMLYEAAASQLHQRGHELGPIDADGQRGTVPWEKMAPAAAAFDHLEPRIATLAAAAEISGVAGLKRHSEAISEELL